MTEINDYNDNETTNCLENNKTINSTKAIYCSKIKIITKFIGDNYSSYVRNNELILPLPWEPIKHFMDNLTQPAIARKEYQNKNEIPENLAQPFAVSTIQCFKSALIDYYKQKKVDFDPNINNQWNTLLDSYEKLINQLRQNNLINPREGRHPLKFEGYRLLAKKFLTKNFENKSNGGNWNTSIFSWCFLILQWNLMSRSESVDKLMLNHIDWNGDSLTIEEQGQKADQRGENKYTKHIYANPFDPEICPILSLAILVVTTLNIDELTYLQLFAGTNSKDRFGKNLQSILSKLTVDEMITLGDTIDDIGTQSIRKGSGTYCLGQVAGPNPVAVSLRMGQSLGTIRDKYIFEGDGLDQLCGRMVSGLPFNDEKFSVLPPHFNEEGRSILTHEYFTKILGCYSFIPDSFKRVIPYLFASLIYHEEFLRKHLPSNHSVFQSPIFSQECNIAGIEEKYFNWFWLLS